MGCFEVAEFLLTSASRGPSAIAEPLVIQLINIDFNYDFNANFPIFILVIEKNNKHCLKLIKIRF